MQKKIIAAIVAVVVIVAAIGAALLLTSSLPPATEKEPVYYVSMGVGTMKNALSTNASLGGYIAWEPFGSDGIVSGVGHALKWSGEVKPNHPCCVVLVSDAFLSTSLGVNLTVRFLKAHIDATNWMNAALADKAGGDYTKLVDMAMKFTGRNETVVKAALDHMKYDYAISQETIDYITWFAEQFVDIGQMTNASIIARGYSSAADFSDKYTDTSYLADAASVGTSSTMVGSVRLGYLTGDLHQLAQYVARNTTNFGGTSMFAKYGVNVSSATGAPYSSGPTEMDNFANGNIDIGYLGAPPAILKHINNPKVDAKIVAQANTEGSALVVLPSITSLEELRGLVVAIPSVGSIQYLLLQVMLKDAGIRLVAG